MEKYSVSTNKKRRRKMDRFNSLPDSLLVHILSFLPPKKAVATSLLSKRWRPLWRSLPTLHLNREHYQRLTSFHRFVDKMLKFVDLKSVKTFVLWSTYYQTRECFRPGKINKWIDAVISINRVEHLELHLQPHKDNYEFPSSVFTANKIKVLKLSGLNWMLSDGEVTVGALSRANLPLLEVLHLRNVNFPVDTLSYVNLPLLQVLHLRDVKFPVLASLEMLLNSCPLLKDLAIEFSSGLYCGNSLNIGRLEHLVTVQVPPCLIPMDALSNATNLRFISRNYKKEDVWPFSNYDIPMFSNVTHLECVAREWTKMVNCLQNFPKLQELVIYEHGSSSSLAEPILDVPPCVSLHLKEFTLLQFRGSESESEMINFMMKNAQVLRAVYVCCGSSKRELPSFKKLATSLRSGTENCIQMHAQPLVFMFS